MGRSHIINKGHQGRASTGFSLRKALENQGVTTEDAMREHLSLVASGLRLRPDLDITRYRGNNNNK